MARKKVDEVVAEATAKSDEEKALAAEKAEVQSEETDHQASEEVDPNDSVPEAQKDEPRKDLEEGVAPAQVSAYGDENTKVTDVGVSDPDPKD